MPTYQQELETDLAALFARSAPFFIVDTETTGLLSDPDGQIIEIAAVNPAGEVVFHSLVKPDVPVSSAATKVHGITDADLVVAPTFPEIWRPLTDVLTSVPLIFCYNMIFDHTMLKKTAKRFGCVMHPIKIQEWKCMMVAYAKYHGVWDSYHKSYTYQKLHVACARLGVPLSQSHRATGDCLNTLGLMRALAARADAPPVQQASEDIQ
jgi:DNA polymerase-3 subunit epsilon